MRVLLLESLMFLIFSSESNVVVKYGQIKDLVRCGMWVILQKYPHNITGD